MNILIRNCIVWFVCFMLLTWFACSEKTNTETGNPTNTKIDSNQVTVDTSLSNLHICSEAPYTDSSSQKNGKQAGVLKYLLWPSTKKTLIIRFMDGEAIVQKKVQEVAKEWEPYCHMRFDFEDTGKADITISFRKGGSWSCIGISSANHIPSMNLGWLTAETSDSEYHRIVLHEFGHALGLIHEHQNPYGMAIQWDSNMVYQYFLQTNGWDKKRVNSNIFEQYARDCVNGTAFDSLSIMLYAIDKKLTKNAYSTNTNWTLSENDKQFVSSVYAGK